MKDTNFDLFILLLKLKSYLVSMIDDENECPNNFYFTEEYLSVRFPNHKEEVINLLRAHKINNDCDIVFNENIHNLFKDMAAAYEPKLKLDMILEKQQIQSLQLDEVEKYIEDFRFDREVSVKGIVGLLLKLAKLWTNHYEMESQVDDYLELDEKEVLRPEEEKKFTSLDKNIAISLDNISLLTKNYLEIMIDYLFKFGGDVQLKNLVAQFDDITRNVEENYKELFNKSGLKGNQSEKDNKPD